MHKSYSKLTRDIIINIFLCFNIYSILVLLADDFFCGGYFKLKRFNWAWHDTHFPTLNLDCFIDQEFSVFLLLQCVSDLFLFFMLTPLFCQTTCSHAMIFSVLIIHSNEFASVRFVQSVSILLGEYWYQSFNIRTFLMVSQRQIRIFHSRKSQQKGPMWWRIISGCAASRTKVHNWGTESPSLEISFTQIHTKKETSAKQNTF